MKKIVFATNNKHKLNEIRNILIGDYEVFGLQDIGFGNDIPETGSTLKENASIKSKTIFDLYNINCFSDDTGLIIESLGGDPGVYSARYAGCGATYEENVDKVLFKLKGQNNRKAAFSTVISLLFDNIEYFFEGKISGTIANKRYGDGGFGYDPIFIPEGYDITFAEMPIEIKNKISHRAIATQKLVAFLNKHVSNSDIK